MIFFIICICNYNVQIVDCHIRKVCFAKAKLIWDENFVICNEVINPVINILFQKFWYWRQNRNWTIVNLCLSPDLKTGLTSAIFNFDGTIPVDKEQLKIRIRTSIISGTIRFNTFELIPSTPLLVTIVRVRAFSLLLNSMKIESQSSHLIVTV